MSDAESYMWDLQGYLIVHRALSSEQLTALRDAVAYCQELAGSAVTTTEARDGGLLSIPRPHCVPFRELLAHPAVVERLNAVCGKRFRLDAGPSLLARTAGDTAPAVRRRSIVPGFGYHYQNGLAVVDRVTVLWSLWDVTGELALVPAGHKANLPTSDALGAESLEAVAVRPPVDAGDAMIVAEGVATIGPRDTRGGKSPWAVSLTYSPRAVMVGIPDQAFIRPEIWWDDPRLSSLMTAEQRAVMFGPGTGGAVPGLTVSDAGVVELRWDDDGGEHDKNKS